MFYLAKTESSIKQRTQDLLSINVLLENSDFIKKMILKVCNTLLTVTPYDKMSPGMSSVLIREIYNQESKPNGIITQYSNLHNLALKIVGTSYSIGLPEVF